MFCCLTPCSRHLAWGDFPALLPFLGQCTAVSYVRCLNVFVRLQLNFLLWDLLRAAASWFYVVFTTPGLAGAAAL